ncbi:P-loop ATPase, Sll1717 family [Chitiniphilus eburneus]|uniref:FunZ protein n=1 Tax=Chitiniphilus eburneus TaxID=2571148 RepID=A0A4U0Q8G7_9NEIS|nr:hypothetical protein [Chitiniphilus eburneus]TJZ77536.1 hypothetical protein FAZ21_04190 [Chitiniphilus eburneus]
MTKKINELVEPSLDAIDYKVKERKKFFNSSYVETKFLTKVCNSNCYYIIGEKGVGKTALAFHMQQTSPKNISSKLISISETQYTRFIKLKENGKLDYTDYSIIWRATLLYLMAKLVIEKERTWVHRINRKFADIEKAINKYDQESHIPELEYVVEFVTTLTQSSEISGSLPETAKAGLNESNSQTKKLTSREIKLALLECEKILKAGLQGIKLSSDVALFIDGLDAKPNEVDFAEYQKCLIGLAEAAWHLNSDYFASIKDTHGRMRCVLLLRPDVFDSLNLHNSNCKLEDNSVIFDWQTTNDNYRDSDIFNISNKYFTSQLGSSSGWNAYFQEQGGSESESFKYLLKHSFHRPRDIFAAIKTLISINANQPDKSNFHFEEIKSSKFTDKFSEYLLGEVKNYANYYITNKEFDDCIVFFQYLHGSTKFSYQDFIDAYNEFIKSPNNSAVQSLSIAKSAEAYLQFWYSVNVIGYTESLAASGGGYWHWSYRERSPSKVMPRVKENCNYKVNFGVAKSLNLGKKFRSNPK